MRKVIAISVLLKAISVVSASSIDIYLDKSIYRYFPSNDYIGFISNSSITCGESQIETIYKSSCSIDNPLCIEYNKIDKISYQISKISYTIKSMDKILNGLNLQKANATLWIDTSKKIADEYASLQKKRKDMKEELVTLQKSFSRKATSKKALYLNENCKYELKIKIPSAYIKADYFQEADILDNNQIKLSKYLTLKNRSGIDIVAKSANIYFKNAYSYINIPKFKPLIVSIQDKKRVYKSPRVNRMMPMVAKSINRDIIYDSIKRDDFRTYKISNLILPSNGKLFKQKISEETLPTKCKNIAYSFISSQVYRVCSFKSSSSIEKSIWRVTEKGKILSEYAKGEYVDNHYVLYAGINNKINITRVNLPDKEKKSGFFGSEIRKRDGYILKITNRSQKSQIVEIIDRIPYSDSDKISVSLKSVEGVISYKMMKYGKIKMLIKIDATTNRDIKVLYELKYKKDITPIYK